VQGILASTPLHKLENKANGNPSGLLSITSLVRATPPTESGARQVMAICSPAQKHGPAIGDEETGPMQRDDKICRVTL
jgi:hypothetical protein